MALTPHTSLRLGFVGGGLNSAVGYTHFNASRLDGHFRVESGCFSRHPDQNEQSATAYGVPVERTYPDWKSFLNNEKDTLDAVVILTPTPDHAEVACKALDQGYAVICEKSLATSSSECRVIGETFSRNSSFLAVTFNYSGYPMVRELRRLITEGALGRLQQIHIEMPQEGFLRQAAAPQAWRLRDYAVPTVSLDLGVHVHHLIHFLTGGLAPIEVIGDQKTYGHFADIIDNVYCIARYEEGLRAQVWYGKTALGYRNGLRVRVFGSDAATEWFQMAPEELRISYSDGRVALLDRGGAEAQLSREPRYNRFKSGHPSGFIEAFANLYADIAEHLRAFQSEEPAPSGFVFGATHAEEGLRFVEAISRSAQTRSWQAV